MDTKKARRKVKLISKHLTDLKEMWLSVTYNTPVDIGWQLDEIENNITN